MSIQWNSFVPVWVIALVAAVFSAVLVYVTLTMVRKQVPARWMVLLSTLRLAIFAVFVLMLLQPALSYVRQIVPLPEYLVLVDTSQSMGKSSGGHGSRLEEVTAVLHQSELSAALHKNYRLHWFAFDRTATPVAETDLAALKAVGDTTVFAQSIEAACQQMRAQGHPPQRLLLVSDGNDRGRQDAVETARRWGVAVDVLAPSAGSEPIVPALDIAEVQGARRVLLGSETHFRVTLRRNLPADRDQKLVLRVTEDGKKILDHPLDWKAGRIEQSLLLSHRPAASGLKQYEFQLHPAEGKAGSSYPLPVQVLDSKYEVLILEDRWRWEYKYLHRLFEDDPSFRFSALLSRGGGAFVQFASPDRRVNLVGFPQGRADLESFDLFVLGDVNPAQWPRGLAVELARQITEEGKSLVVIAGPGLAHLRELPDLHALLPVELTADSGKPIEGPIEVRLRPQSAGSAFFFPMHLGDTEKLPPLDQIYPVLRQRPGATVLLEAARQRNAYGPSIVIAEQTVGRGRVLYLGADALWKWHTLAPSSAGPTPYSIFWQQAFRALTPARSKVGAVNLWLTANQSRAEVGRPIAVQAEVESSRPVTTASLQAEVSTADEQRLPLVFTVDPANPRRFRAEFTLATKGTQRIQASLSADGKLLAESSTAIEVEEPYSETDDRGVDQANLARLAQGTGGRVLDPARPETWPTSAEHALPAAAQWHTVDLWNNFSLLLVLCVLLGADWFLRLFKGLVAG